MSKKQTITFTPIGIKPGEKFEEWIVRSTLEALFGMYEHGFYATRKRHKRNPLWAWEAIEFCNEREVQYPEWVREYLGEVRQRMNDKQPPAKCLDMTMKDYSLTDVIEARIVAVKLVWVRRYYHSKTETLEQSIEKVSVDLGMSYATLEEWWYAKPSIFAPDITM